MTISYKWLSEYLPVKIEPQQLSEILTSVGLEVEKMEVFEEVKGGMEGLVIGKVLETQPHPNADKLKLTKVDTGGSAPLNIVCGAPNVAAGQKVVVATVGTTIYPLNGEPMTMKLAKIRGMESQGMICAEDEIGLGASHAGIMVLNEDAVPGTKANEYFKPYSDTIYHIGLTPNRMDAMSHWGVARDVCAYISHHENKSVSPIFPSTPFTIDDDSMTVSVQIDNKTACRRYSGVSIAGVEVKASPAWLQQKLKSIGLRPINNIVDITNFIQHETGQPLHAFDLEKVHNKTIIVKTLDEGTAFTTLDEKQRKLSAEDLMICDDETPLCIAGVFGGMNSGVTATTKNIFLESAWFDPIYIRKTSFRHGLRTDAATRFEKGTDISNTVKVLERAAVMIKEIAGGKITSGIVDVYPNPQPKKQVKLSFDYIKKISGKQYDSKTLKNILAQLGFDINHETNDSITVSVPYHKTDITLPADIAEEILRIDGLDNIPIPSTVSITPSVEENQKFELLKEKISQVLTGLGFTEILTNSITNSAYFSESELEGSVKLLNNLSSELDMLRPSMLHTALEVISFNINRKNSDLKFFEFGKTYHQLQVGEYREENHVCLYITGKMKDVNWNAPARYADIYFLKGITETVLNCLGIKIRGFEKQDEHAKIKGLKATIGKRQLLELGEVDTKLSSQFDIKQKVFVLDMNWDLALEICGKRVQFKEISKFPSVERDLAMIVPKELPYAQIETQIGKLKLDKLREIKLFDVFESEKLGQGKKSMAINLTFMDNEKTLTDKEIDNWMNKIMNSFEKDLNAEIRK